MILFKNDDNDNKCTHLWIASKASGDIKASSDPLSLHIAVVFIAPSTNPNWLFAISAVSVSESFSS